MAPPEGDLTATLLPLGPVVSILMSGQKTAFFLPDFLVKTTGNGAAGRGSHSSSSSVGSGRCACSSTACPRSMMSGLDGSGAVHTVLPWEAFGGHVPSGGSEMYWFDQSIPIHLF